MPEPDSKKDPPSAEDSGVGTPTSSAETDAGWDTLVGDSEKRTASVAATPNSKPPTPARPPLGLSKPTRPGAPRLPPLPGMPAAPPVPGIKPGPLFTPLTNKPSEADDAVSEAEDGDDDAVEIDADLESESGRESEPADPPTERTPVRLPTPGVWGKQAPHDAVIDFVRREDATDFLAKAAASASEDAESSAPREIAPQDTQALIASMAEEIEEVAEAQKVAEEAERIRKAKEAALLEQPTIIYDRAKQKRASDSPSGRMGWLAIAAAAVAGVVLIGWSIAGGSDEASEAESASDPPAAAVAAVERPGQMQPADPIGEPVPVPVPVPVPTLIEAETGADAETGPDELAELEELEQAAQAVDATEEATQDTTQEPTSAPPATNKKSRQSTKKSTSQSSPRPTSQGPKPADKPAKKPAPSSKSASDLLRDARKANAAGQASKAYSLANESYQKKASSDAAEVMVIAACKMKNTGKARTALNRVKLLERRNVKQRCKSMGVNL